jgi:hypothetical protein
MSLFKAAAGFVKPRVRVWDAVSIETRMKTNGEPNDRQ